MLAPEKVQDLYEELAERCERRGDARQRDIFLVLAADTALASGRRDQAERLRHRLMDLSPHNLLRPFVSLEEALQSSDILEYVSDLRLQFPPEKAEQMLAGLGGATANHHVESPFGHDVYPFKEAASPPASPTPFESAAPSPPPASRLPAKPQRRSPYEDPDYGPKVPSGAPPVEFTGGWIIYLLGAVVILMGLGLLAFVLGRPFLGH